MKEKRWLTIDFNDGKQIRFDFPVRTEDNFSLAGTIKRALNENHLSIEVEGVLYIFPWTSIKYFRISPCPEKLPDTVITGGKMIDSGA